MAYLLAKKPELHFEYDEIMHEAHHRAFTVAKITRLDLLEDIQKSLILAQKNGESFEHWKKNITPTLQQKGWWGQKEIANPKNGELKTINITPRRLRTIYDTNMRVAYAQGRAKAQYALEGDILFRYVAILDSHTRESHRRLHGTILPREHPFWARNYPPNGWRCRCRVDAYPKEQVEEKSWKVSQNAPDVAEKDWNHDTRGLSESKELEKIYLQKAKRVASIISPSKLLSNFLKEDLKGLVENKKRWSELSTLFSFIKQNPTSTAMDKHFIVLAPLSKYMREDLQKASGLDFIVAKDVLLSGATIRAHFHHDNVGAFDYYLVAHFGKPYKTESTKTHHMRYFYQMGHYYRAVFKVTKSGEGVFLQSLVKSNKKM